MTSAVTLLAGTCLASFRVSTPFSSLASLVAGGGLCFFQKAFQRASARAIDGTAKIGRGGGSKKHGSTPCKLRGIQHEAPLVSNLSWMRLFSRDFPQCLFFSIRS